MSEEIPPPVRRHPLRAALAGVLVIATAGCAAHPPAAAAWQRPAAHSAASAASSQAAASASLTVAEARPSSSRRTAAAPEPRKSTRPTSAAGGARLVHGVILPDAHRTPGATNPAVTPATISSTICVSGWTARVRPSSSYTTALKREQLASGYAWHGDTSTVDYEEDHLIPLELGGSPSSPANLWPEPYDHSGDEGAVSKDAVENRLHELVCSRALGLRDAQRAIAGDWWLAAREYPGVPVAGPRPSSPKPVVAAPRRSTPPPAPAPHACTTTSSGNCIRGGQFCPKSHYGQTGYDASGRRYACSGNASHPRWQ